MPNNPNAVQGVKKAKSGEQARWTTKYGTMARTDYR